MAAIRLTTADTVALAVKLLPIDTRLVAVIDTVALAVKLAWVVLTLSTNAVN